MLVKKSVKQSLTQQSTSTAGAIAVLRKGQLGEK